MTSLVRMSVSIRAVFVRLLAMFARRACVVLGFFVFAHRVMMLGLMVMMCGSVMVRGGEVMVFTRGMMMLRFLRHRNVSPWVGVGLV